MINSIEAHPFEQGGLYVAATGYKQDDFAPYLYRTTDWGQSWTKITDGIADDHFTRVIRADPDRAGLLYAGTERGVYVSFDDGARWQSLQLNLPIVPITDLAAARAALRSIADRWNAIGHVPRADRDRVEGRLRRVEDAVHRFEADQWRRTDPAKRALAESTVSTFRDSLAKLEAEAAAAAEAGNARKAADLEGRVAQTRALLEAAENSLAEYSG
jgi:hypothetical protein